MEERDLNINTTKKMTPEEVVKDGRNQSPWVYLLKKYVGSLEGASVLDTGCGRGGFLLACSKLGADSVGVDPSPAINVVRVGMEQANHPPLLLVRADGREIPFKSESFDIVASIGVLEHVTRPENFVSEMARVLKPGGKFFLIFGPNKYMRFTQSASHREIVFTYWTPRFAERKMRSLQLSSIRRVWAEVVRYRLRHRSFIFERRRSLFGNLVNILVNGADRLPLLRVAVFQFCRILELLSLQRNICLIATKQDNSPSQ